MEKLVEFRGSRAVTLANKWLTEFDIQQRVGDEIISISYAGKSILIHYRDRHHEGR